MVATFISFIPFKWDVLDDLGRKKEAYNLCILIGCEK